MTRKEIANKLNVGTATISRYLKQGMPADKLFISGKKWRREYNYSACKQWLDKQRKTIDK